MGLSEPSQIVLQLFIFVLINIEAQFLYKHTFNMFGEGLFLTGFSKAPN